MEKSHIITTIGQPKVGKTTVLRLLGELLYSASFGIKAFDFATQPASDLYALSDRQYKYHYLHDTVLLFPKPNFVILADNVTDPMQLNLLKQLGANTIRVRNNREPQLGGWQEEVASDYFINNDSSFRMLKFQLRDLFESEIKGKLK